MVYNDLIYDLIHDLPCAELFIDKSKNNPAQGKS